MLETPVAFLQSIRQTDCTSNFHERALNSSSGDGEDYDHLPTAAYAMETETSFTPANELLRRTRQRLYDGHRLRETLNNEILMFNVLKTTTPPSSHHGIELLIQVAQSGVILIG
jgi:hypothetical protein